MIWLNGTWTLLLNIFTVRIALGNVPTKYFQRDGDRVITPMCSPVLGCAYYAHGGNRGVYWAWDRSLGGWVHYPREAEPLTAKGGLSLGRATA